jgi:hypothetical protein
MKILICGSRNVSISTDDITRVFEQLHMITELKILMRGGICHSEDIIVNHIISGGAKGPDSAAIDWASDNLCGWSVVYPEWDKYFNAAGIIRDKQMAEECDICIGFWDGESRGTKFTLEYAKKLGKKTYVVDCSSDGVGEVHYYGESGYKTKW